jgi:NAD-dependent DNA ligase
MPSDKVTQILLSKTDLTHADIALLSEAQAWRWVYSIPKPPRDERLQVCFTGFGAAEKQELEALAEAAKIRVVTRVTKELGILVCGPNAGPKKLETAAAQGALLLERKDFEHFVATGEVPESGTAV